MAIRVTFEQMVDMLTIDGIVSREKAVEIATAKGFKPEQPQTVNMTKGCLTIIDSKPNAPTGKQWSDEIAIILTRDMFIKLMEVANKFEVLDVRSNIRSERVEKPKDDVIKANYIDVLNECIKSMPNDIDKDKQLSTLDTAVNTLTDSLIAQYKFKREYLMVIYQQVLVNAISSLNELEATIDTE